MATKSNIEWTQSSWNPTIGCSEQSPGCRECYAAKMAWRLSHIPAMKEDYEGLTKKLPNGRIIWTGKVKTLNKRLIEPLLNKKPTTYFVDSMSDIFHPEVPFEFIAEVFTVMALTPHHTYQILTKQPKRAREYFEIYENGLPKSEKLNELTTIYWSLLFGKNYQLHPELKKAGWYLETEYPDSGPPETYLIFDNDEPLKNVWGGISAEDQKRLNERAPDHLHTPWAIHFLSYEPALGPIEVDDITYGFSGINGFTGNDDYLGFTGVFPYKFSWIICGGESGHNGRPMHPDWARQVRDQCKKYNCAFFFKQIGEWGWHDASGGNAQAGVVSIDAKWSDHQYTGYGHDFKKGKEIYKIGKAAAGSFLDGVEHKEYPNETRD